MSAVDVFLAREPREEGERMLPYDDKTGLPVKAPLGNLTWGRGYNLMVCGSKGLFNVMDRFLAGALDSELQAFAWYRDAGDVRASVFLDIAYNGGEADLLGYPKMIAAVPAAIASGDWSAVAAQCTEKDPNLDASRYAPLRQLLLTGVQNV